MIRLLTSVNPTGVQPETVLAIHIAYPIWRQLGADVLWVTSLTDGKHKEGSLHYEGKAVDLRVKNLNPNLWAQARDMLQAALGPTYEVFLETDHIHAESDPLHLNR